MSCADSPPGPDRDAAPVFGGGQCGLGVSLIECRAQLGYLRCEHQQYVLVSR